MEKKPTGVPCRVCSGEIVEVIVKEYDSKTGPIIIGPGSKTQYRKVSKGFHCKECGIVYAFLPKRPCTTAKTSSNQSSLSSLPLNHEDTVCKRGKGGETCSFIGTLRKGNPCLKKGLFEEIIKQRRAEGLAGVKRDNCSGPPDFTVY